MAPVLQTSGRGYGGGNKPPVKTRVGTGGGRYSDEPSHDQTHSSYVKWFHDKKNSDEQRRTQSIELPNRVHLNQNDHYGRYTLPNQHSLW